MFLWIICIFVIFYLLFYKEVENFESDAYQSNKKGLICYYGGAFREGDIGTTVSDSEYGYKAQMNSSMTHSKLKKVLNESGYQIDTILNTRQTKYKNKLESWYDPFNLIMNNLSEKMHGRDYMIQSTIENINHINKYDYEFILFSRIDLFLKPEFYEVLDVETDKITFLANNYNPRNCRSTSKGSPEVVDLFIIIPKKYYYILDKHFKLNHDSWSYLKKQYKLKDSDFGFMSDKMFDSNSALDQNPYYLMSSRPENKNIHTNATFDINRPTLDSCPEYKMKNQKYIEDPTQYYIDKYESFYK